MNIIMLAPPGGGKGTIANELVKEFGFIHISTGDLLREEIAKGTDIGNKTKDMIQKGELVSDDIVIQLIKNKINNEAETGKSRTEEDEEGSGFKCFGHIFDGFPRNIEQADMLEKNGIIINLVLEIKVKDERVISRLSSRRICKKCNAVFNLVTNPPKTEGVCDNCGGELYQRKDDTESAIRHRLEIYYNSTAQLKSYYEKKGILKEINGDYDTIPPVADQAVNIIREMCGPVRR